MTAQAMAGSLKVDFEMSLNRISLYIPRGSTANLRMIVASINGFSGEIQLQSEVFPSGLIVSIPITIKLGHGERVKVEVKISVPKDVSGGVYYARVVGNSGFTHIVAMAIFVA